MHTNTHAHEYTCTQTHGNDHGSQLISVFSLLYSYPLFSSPHLSSPLLSSPHLSSSHLLSSHLLSSPLLSSRPHSSPLLPVPLSLSHLLPLLFPPHLQFKRFHREIIAELEKKTDLDVKYMTVSITVCVCLCLCMYERMCASPCG